MSLWNICVPGPSYDPASIPGAGKVVCVNAALKGAPRCDYWGGFDSPNDIHLVALADFKRLRPQVVTDRSRVVSWERWWREHRIPRGDWPSVHTPTYGPLWFKVAAKSPFYSFFGVMSFAIQEGATHLHIVGCDLAGRRYFDDGASSLARVTARPQRVWDMRWQKERQMLANLIEVGPQHGITFSGVDVAKLAP